jgi:hypothetical protein
MNIQIFRLSENRIFSHDKHGDIVELTQCESGLQLGIKNNFGGCNIFLPKEDMLNLLKELTKFVEEEK